MNILYDLAHNHIFITAGDAWAIAQIIKTIIDFIINGKVNCEILI